MVVNLEREGREHSMVIKVSGVGLHGEAWPSVQTEGSGFSLDRTRVQYYLEKIAFSS